MRETRNPICFVNAICTGINNPSVPSLQHPQEDYHTPELPNVDDIDPDLLKPIPDSGRLFKYKKLCQLMVNIP